VRKKIDGGKKNLKIDGEGWPFLYLGYHLLKVAVPAELLRPEGARESSSWDRKVSLRRVSQLPGNQSEKTRRIWVDPISVDALRR
jgi:hypothetical protein